MNKISHLPINWTDGVKISANHFFQSYYNTLETIKEYKISSQKSFEYGILEGYEDSSNIHIDVLTGTDNSLIVKLRACNAVTQKGYKILFNTEIYGTEFPTATFDLASLEKKDKQEFYVVVSISPFDMVPVGVPDPEVVPLHHPYVLPKIELHVVPLNQMNTSFLKEHFLVVSKVVLDNGVFTKDEKYIPPSINLKSNKTLSEFNKNLSQVLIRVKGYTIQVFKKNRNQKNSNTLVSNTFELCEKLHSFYSENIFYIDTILYEQSPIHLVKMISVLANELSIALSIMDETDKEKLLQYYYEWTDIKPSTLLDSIANVASIQYNHIEIQQTIAKLSQFIAMLEGVFKKMSDLEYIGQRKDNIVISEEVNTTKQERGRNTSWSIID